MATRVTEKGQVTIVNRNHAGAPAATRVTQKGQVTIPKELRERVGIRPGDEIEWMEADGKIVGTRVRRASSFAKWRGTAPDMGVSVDEFIEEIRGR
jgi:antitoxin PrlF